MEHKLIIENWRRFTNEQMAAGQEDQMIQVMKSLKEIPGNVKISPGLKDLYDVITILDPTSITSYPEAVRAINTFQEKPSYYNGAMLTLALLSLVPVAGKVAKVTHSGLKLKAKTITAADKMKQALQKIPGGSDIAGKIDSAYNKQKELRGRSPS